MTIKIYTKGKGKEIIIGKKVKYQNRELAVIDYTESTAWNNFCKIIFKDNNESYFIPSWRLEDSEG